MRIVTDVENCIASGACVNACPEVFAQDADGIVKVLATHPPSPLHQAVEDAVAACPAAVIDIEADG